MQDRIDYECRSIITPDLGCSRLVAPIELVKLYNEGTLDQGLADIICYFATEEEMLLSDKKLVKLVYA